MLGSGQVYMCIQRLQLPSHLPGSVQHRASALSPAMPVIGIREERKYFFVIIEASQVGSFAPGAQVKIATDAPAAARMNL